MRVLALVCYPLDTSPGQRYRIEPQCNLGLSEGVSVQSKPDYVIWPWQGGSARRPVAVFCDGWGPHSHSVRADALKRSAIAFSGKFWVWSVTHDDVKAALAGNAATDLESPLVTHNRHDGSKAPPALSGSPTAGFAQHAVARLLAFLALPTGKDEALDAGVLQIQRAALWLTYLMVPASLEEMTQTKAEAAPWLQKLPGWGQPPGSSHVLAMSRAHSQPRIICHWPLSAAQAALGKGLAPGALIFDDAAEQPEDASHLQWRRWLSLYNLLQVLPGMAMATNGGLAAGDCDGLNPATPSGGGAGSADQAAWSQAWIEAMELTLPPLRPGMQALAQQDVMAPLVGHELADDRGEVVAEAELAWPDQQLVLLTHEQADMADVWIREGWRAMVLEMSGTSIAGADWFAAVGAALRNTQGGTTEASP